MSGSLTAEVSAALRRQPGINVLMAIGNSLRQDDGVGPLIAAQICDAQSCAAQSCATQSGSGAAWHVIDAGCEPENYYESVVALRPDYLLILDAADFGGHPGDTRLIGKDEVSDYTLSTHVFPIRAIWELVESEISVCIRLIGIQPGRCGLGEKLSAPVRLTAGLLVAELLREE
jgi:hydrogenase 3 maturation protease